MSHAFIPSLRHEDYCAHCSNPRSDRAHDILHTARPNLALKLATLLGCSELELRDQLRELVLSAEDQRSLHLLSTNDDFPKARPRRATVYDEHRGRAPQCEASIGDDNRCERLQGHPAEHAFISLLWLGHAVTKKRCNAIDTVRARNLSSSLVTFRCVLPDGHDGDAHELDNGEVFR